MPSWSRSIPTLIALASTAALPVNALPRSSLHSRATNFCGDQANQVIQGTPWIVYNMLYNSADLTSADSWCTVYDGLTSAADGTKEIQWGSTSTISAAKDTVKGYSFIGLTQGLSNTLNSISSIPASYSWTRTNTTAFKGNIVFDFMTNDKKGDSTSTDSHELMLWLQYEGGQLPIGYTRTPTKVNDLFGTSWSLYSGKNTDTGITVTSMLADTQFDDSFTGDLMDWMRALVDQGLFSMGTYLNVGNAGTEIFYGDSTMSSTLGLQVNVGSSSSSSDKPAPSAPAKTASSSTAVVAPLSSTVTAPSFTIIAPVESATSAKAEASASDAATGVPTGITFPSESVATSATSVVGGEAPVETGAGAGEEDDTCDA